MTLWLLVSAAGLLLVGVGGWFGWRWWQRRQARKAYEREIAKITAAMIRGMTQIGQQLLPPLQQMTVALNKCARDLDKQGNAFLRGFTPAVRRPPDERDDTSLPTP
jgi:hypothetical protein